MKSCFSYRLPGDKEMISGAARDTLAGLHPDGFVTAPFSNCGEGVITIPAGKCSPGDIIDIALSNAHSGQPLSTPRSAHHAEVEEIVKVLGGEGKIVAARCIAVEGLTDIASTFGSLCRAYPSAFVFLFSSPGTGTWIGASPELLIEYDALSKVVRTMSLAGTRPAADTASAANPAPWDIKNIEEQQMVTDFISMVLARHTSSHSVGTPFTRNAGPVEHICTSLEGLLVSPLTDLLRDLSPTPALCGSDRETAMRIISSCEDFDREYYGGYCGPVDRDGSCRLFVNLRSARLHHAGMTLFAGGGITPLSIPENEWLETERKASTLISHLKFIEKR